MRFLNAAETGGWAVTLKSGGVVVLWADSFSIEGDTHLFSSLVDASAEEREHLRINARTPTDEDRVVITIATIPSEEIASLRSY